MVWCDIPLSGKCSIVFTEKHPVERYREIILQPVAIPNPQFQRPNSIHQEFIVDPDVYRSQIPESVSEDDRTKKEMFGIGSFPRTKLMLDLSAPPTEIFSS